jgi:hypothetical protein
LKEESEKKEFIQQYVSNNVAHRTTMYSVLEDEGSEKSENKATNNQNSKDGKKEKISTSKKSQKAMALKKEIMNDPFRVNIDLSSLHPKRKKKAKKNPASTKQLINIDVAVRNVRKIFCRVLCFYFFCFNFFFVRFLN